MLINISTLGKQYKLYNSCKYTKNFLEDLYTKNSQNKNNNNAIINIIIKLEITNNIIIHTNKIKSNVLKLK